MAQAGPYRILIVASDSRQRAALRELIESAAHQVMELGDAERALAKIEESRPDLVVAGLTPGQLEGWTVCRLLKKYAPAGRNRPPVLILSEQISGGEAAQMTALLGGSGFLPYPIDRERLAAEVDSLAGSARGGAAGDDGPAAQDAEERLQLTLNAANTVAWDVDAVDGSLHEAGPVYRLFGQPEGFHHASVRELVENIHPADRDRVLAAIEASVRGDSSYRVEFRVPLADGTEKWIAANGTLLRDREGKPARLMGVAIDATERKQAEMRLRESEAELAAAQRIAGVGSWRWHVPTDEARWSEETFRIFGLQPGDLKQHGARFLEMLHPEDRPRVGEALRTALAGAEYDLNYRILRPDGAERILHAQAEVLRDETGRAVLLHGTVHDVTERTRADKALRESEEKYRLTFQNIPAGVEVHEADGTVSLVNAEAARLSAGFPGPLGIAHPGTTFVSGDGAACGPEDMPVRRCFRTGEPQSDKVLGARRQDGSMFWAVCSATPLADPASGKVIRVVLAYRDITEHRHAEEALRESEERFAAFMSNLPAAAFVKDDRGRTLFVNPYLANLLAFQNWEEKSTPELVPGELGHQMAEDDRRALAEGPLKIEESMVDAEGTPRTFETIKFPIKVGGKTVLLGGIATDVTDRKQAAEEKERLQQELAQAQKVESIGRLAGGVAHDFNNLLTVINGYSALVRSQLKEGDPLAEAIQEIHNAGQRAAQLTKQLLAFSRKQMVDPKPLNLNALIDETRDMLRRLMGEDIEVTVRLAPDLGQVMADPGNVHQILMNLAVNARDAMPQGGTFAIETANIEPGHFVRLRVSDTGMGMTEEIRQRIFDPFFTTKGEGKGTGLGLSTVYGIVRQAEGTITVWSEPGRGATFTIDLPRTEECEVPAQGEPPRALEQRGTERVLVVEDQAEVRKLAVKILKHCGYRILEAANGSEALLCAEREPDAIDLLLTDVVMPGMTGVDLAQKLKLLRPRMKVLYMSGYAADVVRDRGLPTEGAAHIAKPFTPDALTAKVRDVLRAERTPATVLVVDDEAGVRELFRKVLSGAGYEVVAAENGKQALEIARALKLQAVLTDLVMPEQEGIETIQMLRREAPDVPIIAVGALGGQFLRLAKMLGASAVLSKPVSSDVLLAKLAEVLEAQ